MRLFKITCYAIVIFLTLWGCSAITGDDGDSGDETVEYNLSVSTSPSEGGSVDPSSGTYEEGSEVSVEAIPNNGWAFSNWSGDQESGDNPLTFTITEDTELTANFDDQRSMYAMEMDVIDAEDTLKVAFGQAEDATEAFDDGKDEEAPPPPPEGTLHAYFDINDLDLFKDYRSNTSQQVEWALQYQVGSGEDLKLEWSLTDDTQIEGTLILTDSEGTFEVDMLNESSHTLSGTTSGSVLIQYNLE